MSKSSQAAKKEDKNSSYDEVPYENTSHPMTHPDVMAVVGTLFGLEPADLKTADVLELGCAGGGNLIPLAMRYPKASFTGLDLSERQIDFANEQKKAIGLKNIEFLQQDIMAFDLKKNKKKYDYIICHGVYSWVPEEVAGRALDICRECLADGGLAVVSYNTLPGWNAVRSLREMMLYHSKGFPAAETVARSRQLLDFLSENATQGNGYRALIEGERELLAGRNDSYLFHDHLESVNRPVYFHEFAADLKKHGLTYVGDSSVSTMFINNLPPKVAETLAAINDLGQQEQYIDFVMNRRFRTSIICKEGAAINRDVPNSLILDLCMTPNMKPAETNPDFNRPVRFVTLDGKGSFTAHTPVIAVLCHEVCKTGNRPVSAPDLLERACKRLPDVKPDAVKSMLVDVGLRLALGGFIMLHMNSPAYEDTVSKKPVANALARLQASRVGCKAVTTLLGNMIALDALACMVVPQLDGKNTVDNVVASLVQDALDGEITVSDRDQTVLKDKASLTAKLKEMVTSVVDYLAKEAVLEA